jgi:hypothetical protein
VTPCDLYLRSRATISSNDAFPLIAASSSCFLAVFMVIASSLASSLPALSQTRQRTSYGQARSIRALPNLAGIANRYSAWRAQDTKLDLSRFHPGQAACARGEGWPGDRALPTCHQSLGLRARSARECRSQSAHPAFGHSGQPSDRQLDPRALPYTLFYRPHHIP